jgi:photosystem II stability/assembly factor-like uncharacterized protein
VTKLREPVAQHDQLGITWSMPLLLFFLHESGITRYRDLMRLVALFALALVPAHARAQWNIQQSHTTASLRSVHAVSEMVAWASGANGTVLRTKDGGVNWQSCTVPKGAEKLDLVSVQGSDENTAVAISTGKGSLSGIYKTADGCQTWRLVFSNPDASGSFKSIHRVTDRQLYLLGDPVDGKFTMFYSADGGETWNSTDDPGLDSEKGELSVSAGNGTLVSVGPFLFFGARSSSSLHLYHTYPKCEAAAQSATGCPVAWVKTDVPLASGDTGSVGFSFAARTQLNMAGRVQTVLVAVGSSIGSAATSKDDGKSWKVAATPPTAGARAVAYSSSTGSWIAVGPNGTEVSTDDGQKWRPMPSGPTAPKNTGQSWCALSLPFVVGDGGSIGRFEPPK